MDFILISQISDLVEKCIYKLETYVEIWIKVHIVLWLPKLAMSGINSIYTRTSKYARALQRESPHTSVLIIIAKNLSGILIFDP